MTLAVLLKFFQYLALFLAGGLGIGAAVIQIFHHLARLPECGDRMDANLSGIAAH